MPPRKKKLPNPKSKEPNPLPETAQEPVQAIPVDPKDDHDNRLDRLRQKKGRNEKPSIDKSVPDFDPVHQKLFEAPDGAILVGDKDKDRIFYRRMKIWINPKRVILSREERSNLQRARLEKRGK